MPASSLVMIARPWRHAGTGQGCAVLHSAWQQWHCRSIVGLIHAAEPDKFSIKLAQAKVIQQTSSKTGRPGKKSPMTRCLETWDRATQMSKQEWKETCKRTVKEYPDIYNKPF